MGVEIERRFLVLDPPPFDRLGGSSIEQGYLVFGEGGGEVRVRKADERCLLTVKRGFGLSRSELEIELNAAQFEALWPETAGRRLVKRRYAISSTGGILELDVYAGSLSGLHVAEIEFPSEEAARNFVPPAWCQHEITDDPRFRNRNIAALSADELASLLSEVRACSASV